MQSRTAKIDKNIAIARSLLVTDPQQAEKLADRVFRDAQAGKYLQGQADAQIIFALLLADTNPPAAHGFVKSAIEIYRQLNDLQSEAESLMIMARQHEIAGRMTQCIRVLNQALDRARKGKNVHIEVAAFLALGSQASQRRDFSLALKYLANAKTVVDQDDNPHCYWQLVAAEQGVILASSQNSFDYSLVETAGAFFEVEKMDQPLCQVYKYLAKSAHISLRDADVRQYLRKAYSLARGSRNQFEQAEIIACLGEYRFEDGRFRSAKKLLERSLELSNAIGFKTNELKCMNLLAKAKFAIGSKEEAFVLVCNYAALKDELFRREAKEHFEELESASHFHQIEEESKVLKRTNTDLALLNERLEATLLEKKTLQKELERLATIDDLTGALNRRESLAFGSEIIVRFHSQNRPAVVMVVDIDHFKSINDNFGHNVGDEVLRRFTKSCQRVLRPTDRFGRLGGEEFCILLDRTELEIALKVAERVMNSIRSCRVLDILGERSITVSIGIVEVNRKHKTIEAALNDADVALYEAKRTGRDKICVNGVKKKKAA